MALDERFEARSGGEGGYTAYELTGHAVRSEPDAENGVSSGGVVLTSGAPSQGGHVEFVTALDRGKLCGDTAGGCDHPLSFLMPLLEPVVKKQRLQ